MVIMSSNYVIMSWCESGIDRTIFITLVIRFVSLLQLVMRGSSKMINCQNPTQLN